MINQMTNSHILIDRFSYLRVTSIHEAVTLLARYGAGARLLAGGTDLLVQMKMERLAPVCVIDISRIPDLDRIHWRDDCLEIGALATIRSMRRHPGVQTFFPALAEACASFSTTQIQAMGTLGGNLANGSPAADTVPALVAYDAEVVLYGPDGERCLPLAGFLRGPGQVDLRPGEMLVSVRVPEPARRQGDLSARLRWQREEGEQGFPVAGAPGAGTVAMGSAFLKIARVAADLAKASAAVALVREGECVLDVRLAYGAVAPTVRRSQRAEMLLRGQPYSPELAARAGRAAAEEMAPIDDVRSSAWYRHQMIEVMTIDGLARAWDRAGQDGQLAPGREYAGGDAADRTGEPARGGGLSATLVQGAQEQREVALVVNGVPRRVRVAANDLLLNVLRDELELTGTKYGCGIGECSACTVLLDGAPALACLVLATAAEGRAVLTVEGLQRPDGSLDALQEAFLDHAAFQCGFCTPGMLLTAKSLLAENPQPGEDEIRDYLKGNLCRCTGYAAIVRAVMAAARAADRVSG